MSLIVLGIGLGIYAVSDFNFNLVASTGAYTGQAWIVIGWPVGLMLMGVAAYLRSFLPSTSSEALQQRIHRQAQRSSFGPVQSIPYILLATLLAMLASNIFSNDPNQRSNRPVLVFATLVVVALVILRQILTQLDNERLTRQQAVVLDYLETANNQIEEQAQKIAERNGILEQDIMYLKEVHARLANGNLRARARLTRFTSSDLMPLAQSFNLMADRLIHFEDSEQRLQNLCIALDDTILALEKYRMGKPFIMPPSCTNSPEICRFLLAAGFQQAIANLQNISQPLGNERPSTVPPPLATRPMDTPLPISPYPVHPNFPSFPTKSRLINVDQNTSR
jgi:methyl-accepting chemotaxis protein